MPKPDLSPSLVTQWAGCDKFLDKEIQRRKKNNTPDHFSEKFFEQDDDSQFINAMSKVESVLEIGDVPNDLAMNRINTFLI